MGSFTRHTVGTNGVTATAAYYKRDFWSEENLKFSEPWYRVDKSVRLITKIADGKESTLLDVGCGPALLQRVLPPNIAYWGIDIAIHDPAPNLLEKDIIEFPVEFEDRTFDIVVALGVFEYLGNRQEAKFAEIARLLNPGGHFLVSYTNFGHRKPYIYPPFSNVQPLSSFRRSLARSFRVDRAFPVSHNWKHGHPSREVLKAVNMAINVDLPLISSWLGVENFFVCSAKEQR